MNFASTVSFRFVCLCLAYGTLMIPVLPVRGQEADPNVPQQAGASSESVDSASEASEPTAKPEQAASPGPLMTVDWENLIESKRVRGTLDQGRTPEESVLMVTSPAGAGTEDLNQPAGQPIVVPLVDLQTTAIRKRVYQLSGEIRYENVAGNAFLEMWSFFPDGSQYFTRTAASAGPMGVLTGTSDWRGVQLPFQLSEDPNSPRPNRLVVNLIFNGPGTVWLSNLELTESDTLSTANMSAPGAWWDGRGAGWVGGLGGIIFGLLGALLGTCVSRGVGRTFVMTLLVLGVVAGIFLTATGVIAAATQQPYEVYFPLLLMGGIVEVLSVVGLFVARAQYAVKEWQRMETIDAQQG